MNKLKLPALLLAAAMTFSAFSACGNAGPGTSSATSESTQSTESETPAATGDLTKITWFYPDDLTDHSQKVFAAINDYTAEKIGVEVDFRPIPWGEYGEKTNTIVSAGQEFDIMFCNNAYFNNVSTGAAIPVEEYLKKEGKETWDLLPEALWDSVTVNEHIYGIPTYKDNASVPCMLYNIDLAEDLGIEIPATYGAMIELNDLFYDAKAKKDAKYPEDAGIPILTEIQFLDGVTEPFVDQLACANLPVLEVVPDMGAGERVFSYYDTEQYLNSVQTVRNWVEDGIYPIDAQNYDTERSIQNSGKILFRASLGYVSFPEHGWSDDVRTGYIPSSWRCMSTDGIAAGVNLFGAKSKNPDKAVAFMNLVNTDNFVANTIRFGVEGDYYKKTTDNRLDFTGSLNADPANRAYYKWYGWQFGALFSMSIPAQEDSNLWTDLIDANENAFPADNMGFVFDRNPVQNEIAACQATRDEFTTNLGNGMLPDVTGTVTEMRAKLKASGVDTIIAEAQKQLDVWRAANGKTIYQG